MIFKGYLSDIGFQTFYVSKEQSNCPLIADMIRVDRKLKELDLLKNSSEVISFSYGKRMIINSNMKNLGDMSRDDILEIVDYDPVKKIVLTIGRGKPGIETPVHWIIHHARDDINAIIQLNGEKLVERFSNILPSTDIEQPSGTLEQAMEVLKTLRNSKDVVIKNKGVLFVGTSLKEVENLFFNKYRELKL